MKALPYAHMIKEGLSPLRIFLLGKSQTSSCKNELIVVVVVAMIVHKIYHIVDQTEIHTGHQKTFSVVSLELILSVGMRRIIMNTAHDIPDF
jgi:hypothetical protein